MTPEVAQRRGGGLLDESIRESEHRGAGCRDPRGLDSQGLWQSRAAIRMSHLGNSTSKRDSSQSCPSLRLGHPHRNNRRGGLALGLWGTCAWLFFGDRAAELGQ